MDGDVDSVDVDDPDAIRMLQNLGIPINEDGIVTGPGLQVMIEPNMQPGQFEEHNNLFSSSDSDSDIQDVVVKPPDDTNFSDGSYLADSDESTEYFSDVSFAALPTSEGSRKCLNCCCEINIPNLTHCHKCWEEHTIHRPKSFRKRCRPTTRIATLKRRRLLHHTDDSESGFAQDSNTEPDDDEDGFSHKTSCQMCSAPCCHKPSIATSVSTDALTSTPRTCSAKRPTGRDATNAPFLSTSSTPHEPVGSNLAPLCVRCHRRPQDGCFVHGQTSHLVCCYPCASDLLNRKQRCPVCNRTVEKVVRNFSC